MSGLLITALLFPLAGCITGRRPLAECFLLGIGIVGALLFVLGLFHVPFVVTIALVLVVSVWAGFSRPSKRGDRLKPVPTLVIAIPLVLLAISAAIVPLNDFDGRGFWLLKAKALEHERVIDGPFFHNRVVDDPRNQYPLLVPLDAATVMILSGDADDRQVRWLYLFTFAALVFVVARRIHPWCGVILAWIPQFAVSNEGGALTAYCDIAVAAFVTCALLDLMEGESPFRFGLWLAFLILTKNEGLAIALIFLVIGIVSFRNRIVWSMAPVAVAIAALFAWRAGIPRTDEENFVALLPSVASHLDRIVPAVFEYIRHSFAVSKWGLLWIAAWIALAHLAWRKEWRAPVLVLSISAVYVSAYVVTQWTMRELIDSSADRLLMHMIGPALFAIAAVTDASARNRYSRPEYRPKSASREGDRRCRTLRCRAPAFLRRADGRCAPTFPSPTRR